MALSLKSLLLAPRPYVLAARGKVSRYFHDEFVPRPQRDDDLFIVEFPKSGMTWLTFLIANVNVLLSGERRDVTFFNIRDFVPEVVASRQLGSPLLRVPGYRCFSSHSPYTRRYRKVFYLVRDPRHVLPSYHSFLSDLGWWQGTPEDLVRDPKLGLEAWKSHVLGWLDGVDITTSFALIRYEDLVADTAGTLRRLCELQGLPVGDEVLARAVERSNLERMRELEQAFFSGHPALKNSTFVRHGKLGGPRQAFPDELRRAIEVEAGPLMARLGYGVADARPAPAPLLARNA